MPGKELFNQTLKQNLSLTDRFAVGVPNLLGADNITIQDFLRYTGGTLAHRFENITTNQTFTPDSESKIISIDFKNTGQTTATISANCGDEDLVPSMDIVSGAKAENTIMKTYTDPISVNVSGGTVTVVIIYIRNHY